MTDTPPAVTFDFIAQNAPNFFPRTAQILRIFGLSMNEWSKNTQDGARISVVKDPAVALIARLMLDRNLNSQGTTIEEPVRELYSRLKDGQFHPNFPLDRLGIMLGRHKSSGYRWISSIDKTDLIVDRLASHILQLMDIKASSDFGAVQIKRMEIAFPDRMQYLASQGRLSPSALAQAEVIYSWDAIVEQEAAARGVDEIFGVGIWSPEYRNSEDMVTNGDLIEYSRVQKLMKNDAMELFCIPEQKFNKFQSYPDNPIGVFEISGGRSTKSDPTLALFVRLVTNWRDAIETPTYPSAAEMIALLGVYGFSKSEAEKMIGLHSQNISRNNKSAIIPSASPQTMLMHHLNNAIKCSEDKPAFLRLWRAVSIDELSRYPDGAAARQAKAEYKEIRKVVTAADKESETEPSAVFVNRKTGI